MDTHQRIREHLDDLAGRVARATDRDDRLTAWRLLREVEDALEVAEADAGLPPAPVLARRFAHAHRRALREAEYCPDRLAGALPGLP